MSRPADSSDTEHTENAMQAPVVEHSVQKILAAPTYAARNSKIFKAIIEFTDQLNDSFGKEDVNVLKVYRIINKTPLTNRKMIDRHLSIFHQFLEENRDAIIARRFDQFKADRIQLTEKIFMDLRAVIEKSEETSRKAIWQHLFNIMYLYNPEDEIIRAELKVSMAEQETKENKFLMDTFSKFEEAMSKNKEAQNAADPMSMVSNLMQSGFLNDMIGNINNGVSSGSLDIKNLIGTVQNLLGNLSETIEKEERVKK
jgi:hypothetical protein